MVVHKKSGRKIGYGDWPRRAKVPDPLPAVSKADLKPLNQCRFIGKDLARVDVPLKVNGAAKYGIDTQLPNMLYASVLHAPVQGEKPEKIDDAAAKAVKGVIAVTPLPNGVAVIGNTVEATHEGQGGAEGHLDDQRRRRASTATSRSPPTTPRLASDWAHPAVDMLKQGDAAGAIGKAAKVVSGDFVVDHVAHCCMEPLNATAVVEGDRVRLWTSNQSVIDMKLAGSIAGGTKPDKCEGRTAVARRRLRPAHRLGRGARGRGCSPRPCRASRSR